MILDLWEKLQDLHTLIDSLYKTMHKVQNNLKKIIAVMNDWSGQLLFERKGGKKVMKKFTISTIP